MLQGLLGICVLLALAWLMAERRQRPAWRLLIGGLGMQLVLALLMLKAPYTQALFAGLNQLVAQLDTALTAGTSMVFGYLGGAPLPFDLQQPGSEYILAFRALPMILLMSALSSLLYYWKILPVIVHAFAHLLRRAMGIRGALGLSSAGNVFVGMVEAPLLIRPYLADMSRSELFALMSCGMATIAGTVMVLYAGILGPIVPDSMGHILTASLISAPAALVIASLMVPAEPGQSDGREQLSLASDANSSMDALTQGTLDGLRLYLSIIAMLVVFVALVHLANALLGFLPYYQDAPLTLQRLLGWLMAPLMWLLGIPWNEAVTAGSLMGIKTILNEFLAYLELVKMPPEALSERSRLILMYALCGFANFGSLGILIGGLSTLVPERRREITGMAIRSIVAGTLATCMTGALVGLLI